MKRPEIPHQSRVLGHCEQGSKVSSTFSVGLVSEIELSKVEGSLSKPEETDPSVIPSGGSSEYSTEMGTSVFAYVTCSASSAFFALLCISAGRWGRAIDN
eukprot:scaffold154722_cov36-Cyclotella_meneghiniana.AAC.8